MVHYEQVDETLAALADPTRRQVLERLGRGSATVSELAEPFAMTLTGMKKHIRVLEQAQLVRTEKTGRSRYCSLGPERLDELQRWMDSYRQMVEQRLDRLGRFVERRASESLEATEGNR